MNAYGPTFRLPSVVTRADCDPEAWARNEDASLVTHHATHCSFEIGLVDRPGDDVIPDAFAFGARLIHVCDGHELPTRDQQRSLAQEALIFWALEHGFLPPRLLTPDAEGRCTLHDRHAAAADAASPPPA